MNIYGIYDTKNNEMCMRIGSLKEIIIDKFYKGYPELPYISNERNIEWIEQAELFPKQCIIPKSIMTRYSDGLLPGHIYMLLATSIMDIM